MKVPRTATHSFRQLFENYNPYPYDTHNHPSYIKLCEKHSVVYSGVSVVRNPYTKFISSVFYILERQKNETSVENLWSSTKSCIKFLLDNFEKNLHCKSEKIRDLFIDEPSPELLLAYNALFTPQTSLVYHPKVTTFKYENLDEFKLWINTTLGYDTSILPKINQSKYEKILNVDFKSREFIETIEYLFYDDYKVFDYPLQYLT